MSAHKGKKEVTRQDRRVAKQKLRLTLQVFAKPIVNLKPFLDVAKPEAIAFSLN